MIKVTMTTFILIYLSCLLLLFFGLWVYSHLKQRKKGALTPYEVLVICEYCHFPYLAKAQKSINECPQCRSLNKNNLYNAER